MGMIPPPPPHLPWPPVPRAEIERITGKLHLDTFCRQEAEREYEAFLRGEDYRFETPETDAQGYLLGRTSGRPPFPVRREPSPLRS